MKTLIRVLIAGLATSLLAARSTTTQGSQTEAPSPTVVQGEVGGECPGPPVVRIAVDPSGLNLQGGLSTGNFPFLGNANFIVKVDDPTDRCKVTPGSPTYVLVAEEPFVSFLIPGAGCLPGDPGLLMINVFSPSFHQSGPVTWAGPGMPACHSLVIPNDIALCGIRCVGQGLFVDDSGPSAPWVLTEPLRFIIGS